MSHSWSGSGVVTGVDSEEAGPTAGREGWGCLVVEDRDGVVLDFVVENDPSRIPAIVAEIEETAERLGLFDAGTLQRVSLALHEAMINGIHHGNLELESGLLQEDEAAFSRLASRRRRMRFYRDRRLHVAARFDEAGAVFVIRDEGRGFDPARLPDPTDPDYLGRPTGRGLLLIRAFTDEVAFNPTGNQITLTKRRTRPLAGPPR